MYTTSRGHSHRFYPDSNRDRLLIVPWDDERKPLEWYEQGGTELVDLYNQRQERRYWTSSQVQGAKATVKKRKVVASRKAPIASNVSGQALKGVQTRANIFRGKIFHVFESKDPPKKELEKMIVENGGEFAQARTEGNLAIPIGNRLGHPNAQGYKRKDVTILRPAWVVESIKQGRMLPLTEELTLFADAEVEDGPHYYTKLDNLDSQAALTPNDVDDVTEDEDEDEADNRSRSESEERKHKRPYPSPPRDVDLGGVWNLRNVKSDRQVEESETEPESNDERENDLSDIEGDALDVLKSNTEIAGDTEREDYDNEDDETKPELVTRMSLPTAVKEEAEAKQIPEVPPASDEVSAVAVDLLGTGSVYEPVLPAPEPNDLGGQTESKMGETAEAMQYDQDLIFKHLVFYLDTFSNAKQNGLDATKPNKEAEQELSAIVSTVLRHGGTFSEDLFAGSLTHVVQHSDDSKRYKQINRAWKGSILKQIVTPEFVHDSIADGRLLDENGYRPR